MCSVHGCGQVLNDLSACLDALWELVVRPCLLCFVQPVVVLFELALEQEDPFSGSAVSTYLRS